MSSSYRRSILQTAVASALVGVLVLPAGAVKAADTYTQAKAELRVEANDNFDLEPTTNSDSDVWGYIADLQALMGIATPRSDTSIRPRVKFQEYPDRDDRQRFEGFLDLKSLYRWERSQFDVLARYARQDSYNTELPEAGFDDFDPLNPDAPSTGAANAVTVEETRDRLEFRPSYDFKLSERTTLGVEGSYETVDYSTDDASVSSRVGYDYTQGGGYAAWALDPRSSATLGAYATRYEADDGSSDADAYGGNVGYKMRWSEVVGAEALLYYEQNDSTFFDPVRTEESSSGWGGNVTAYWKNEISQWRFSTGRDFRPSSFGGKSTSDQLRMQYKRELSARLSFDGAARYVRQRSLSDTSNNNDRDFARLDLSMRWMMSPTVFFQGGYSYIWEEYQADTDDAANNRLFVSVGYQGLGRQRR